MRHLTISLCMALSAAACLGGSQAPLTSQAQQTTTPVRLKMVRITPLPVDAGREMYSTYCATCHGEDGKGFGPAAPAIESGVPDLTLLAAHNGGIYPKYHVTNALSRFSESHQIGTRSKMPDWYKAFVSLDRTCPARAGVRASYISKYVATLQATK